ncbi:MAG: Peroxidase [Solirubrobacterales bacterium]|nr:Peroxidase [Solirubrobacterales bacterium]
MADVEPEIDLLAPGALADPYSVLAELREGDPVHWSARHGAWLITRYDDCVAAHLDRRLSSDRGIQPPQGVASGTAAAVSGTLAGWMTVADGSEHRRLRSLVLDALPPDGGERLTFEVERAANVLLDDLEERTEIDLVADFAGALPAMIAVELLGLPASDRDDLRRWADDFSAVESELADGGAIDERALQGAGELVAYVERLAAESGAADADDLLGRVRRARTVEGDALTPDEIVAMLTLLLCGGQEAVAGILGNGILSLLGSPEQAARLEAEPQLARTAVEELVRFEGPARVSVRFAAESYWWRGKHIRAGERVLLVLAAANRDPRTFDRPDELDLGRDPNPHLGFGLGPHYCLGAPLARMVGRVAIPSAMRRLWGLRLSAEAPRWKPRLLSRSLAALPVHAEHVVALPDATADSATCTARGSTR